MSKVTLEIYAPPANERRIEAVDPDARKLAKTFARLAWQDITFCVLRRDDENAMEISGSAGSHIGLSARVWENGEEYVADRGPETLDECLALLESYRCSDDRWRTAIGWADLPDTSDPEVTPVAQNESTLRTRVRGLLLLLLGSGLYAGWFAFVKSQHLDESTGSRNPMFLLLVPGAIAFAGLLEALLGRRIGELGSAWNTLSRWQRFAFGLAIILIAICVSFGGLLLAGRYGVI